MTIKLIEAVGDAINIRIIQGSDWLITVSFSDFDLDGCEVRSMVRNKFTDANAWVELTADITATGVGTSVVTLSLTAAETEALAPPAGTPNALARDVEIGPWDFEVEDGDGIVWRPIKRGTAYLNQEATQPAPVGP
jgi:hypothetical protein